MRAVIKWVMDNPFVLSISFHDGRVMINYPWDDCPQAVEGEKSCCPDHDVFSQISSIYANNHPFMWTGKCLCHSDTFSNGISNGVEWYVVDNGMQETVISLVNAQTLCKVPSDLHFTLGMSVQMTEFRISITSFQIVWKSRQS